jgi:hypothetical protein
VPPSPFQRLAAYQRAGRWIWRTTVTPAVLAHWQQQRAAEREASRNTRPAAHVDSSLASGVGGDISPSARWAAAPGSGGGIPYRGMALLRSASAVQLPCCLAVEGRAISAAQAAAAASASAAAAVFAEAVAIATARRGSADVVAAVSAGAAPAAGGGAATAAEGASASGADEEAPQLPRMMQHRPRAMSLAGPVLPVHLLAHLALGLPATTALPSGHPHARRLYYGAGRGLQLAYVTQLQVHAAAVAAAAQAARVESETAVAGGLSAPGGEAACRDVTIGGTVAAVAPPAAPAARGGLRTRGRSVKGLSLALDAGGSVAAQASPSHASKRAAARRGSPLAGLKPGEASAPYLHSPSSWAGLGAIRAAQQRQALLDAGAAAATSPGDDRPLAGQAATSARGTGAAGAASPPHSGSKLSPRSPVVGAPGAGSGPGIASVRPTVASLSVSPRWEGRDPLLGLGARDVDRREDGTAAHPQPQAATASGSAAARQPGGAGAGSGSPRLQTAAPVSPAGPRGPPSPSRDLAFWQAIHPPSSPASFGPGAGQGRQPWSDVGSGVLADAARVAALQAHPHLLAAMQAQWAAGHAAASGHLILRTLPQLPAAGAGLASGGGAYHATDASYGAPGAVRRASDYAPGAFQPQPLVSWLRAESCAGSAAPGSATVALGSASVARLPARRGSVDSAVHAAGGRSSAAQLPGAFRQRSGSLGSIQTQLAMFTQGRLVSADGLGTLAAAPAAAGSPVRTGASAASAPLGLPLYSGASMSLRLLQEVNHAQRHGRQSQVGHTDHPGLMSAAALSGGYALTPPWAALVSQPGFGSAGALSYGYHQVPQGSVGAFPLLVEGVSLREGLEPLASSPGTAAYVSAAATAGSQRPGQQGGGGFGAASPRAASPRTAHHAPQSMPLAILGSAVAGAPAAAAASPRVDGGHSARRPGSSRGQGAAVAEKSMGSVGALAAAPATSAQAAPQSAESERAKPELGAQAGSAPELATATAVRYQRGRRLTAPSLSRQAPLAAHDSDAAAVSTAGPLGAFAQSPSRLPARRSSQVSVFSADGTAQHAAVRAATGTSVAAELGAPSVAQPLAAPSPHDFSDSDRLFLASLGVLSPEEQEGLLSRMAPLRTLPRTHYLKFLRQEVAFVRMRGRHAKLDSYRSRSPQALEAQTAARFAAATRYAPQPHAAAEGTAAGQPLSHAASVGNNRRGSAASLSGVDVDVDSPRAHDTRAAPWGELDGSGAGAHMNGRAAATQHASVYRLPIDPEASLRALVDKPAVERDRRTYAPAIAIDDSAAASGPNTAAAAAASNHCDEVSRQPAAARPATVLSPASVRGALSVPTAAAPAAFPSPPSSAASTRARARAGAAAAAGRTVRASAGEQSAAAAGAAEGAVGTAAGQAVLTRQRAAAGPPPAQLGLGPDGSMSSVVSEVALHALQGEGSAPDAAAVLGGPADVDALQRYRQPRSPTAAGSVKGLSQRTAAAEVEGLPPQPLPSPQGRQAGAAPHARPSRRMAHAALSPNRPHASGAVMHGGLLSPAAPAALPSEPAATASAFGAGVVGAHAHVLPQPPHSPNPRALLSTRSPRGRGSVRGDRGRAAAAAHSGAMGSQAGGSRGIAAVAPSADVNVGAAVTEAEEATHYAATAPAGEVAALNPATLTNPQLIMAAAARQAAALPGAASSGAAAYLAPASGAPSAAQWPRPASVLSAAASSAAAEMLTDRSQAQHRPGLGQRDDNSGFHLSLRSPGMDGRPVSASHPLSRAGVLSRQSTSGGTGGWAAGSDQSPLPAADSSPHREHIGARSP